MWSSDDCTTSEGIQYDSGLQNIVQLYYPDTAMAIGTCYSVSYGTGNSQYTQYIKAMSCKTPIDVDAQALCDAYEALTAGKDALTNWCPDSDSEPYDPCVTGDSAWLGVTCGTVDGAMRVTGLDISGLSLVGTLPATIGYLDALAFFDATGNPDLLGVPLPTGSSTAIPSAQPTGI